MTSRETMFTAFVMRGFFIGTVACLAVWGAHCLKTPEPPSPLPVDAGPRADATIDTARPLPEPPEGSEEYADSPSFDCSAWPDDTGDYGPTPCWPTPDTPPWNSFGKPTPGVGHLAQ